MKSSWRQAILFIGFAIGAILAQELCNKLPDKLNANYYFSFQQEKIFL